MTNLMMTTPDGKKRKRTVATGKNDGERSGDSRVKQKKGGGKKTKRIKTKGKKEVETKNNNGHNKIVTGEATSTSLIDSIFGESRSHDGNTNNAFGTFAPSSLMNSIFDNKKQRCNASERSNINPSMMSLFDNPKIARKSHQRKFHERKYDEKRAQTKSAAVPTADDDDDEESAESVLRILRNRKYRSHHRPLLKKALDFPGVFSNEKDVEGNASFVLDDEEERAKETADAVRDYGFCVLRNVMEVDGETNSLDTQDPLLDVVLPAAKNLQRRLNTALKGRGIHHSTEMFRFREAASRCKGRTDVVFDMFEKDASLIGVREKILRNPKVFPVIQNLLGGGATSNDDSDVKLVYAGLILSYPGSCNQPWHQDGVPLFPEVRREQLALLQASLPPYALNVFLPLEDEDGSIEKGPTEFLPGSHKWKDPNNRLRLIVEKTIAETEDEETDADDDSSATNNDSKAIIAPVLKRGDALIYDYRVCHRGTSNLFGKLEATENENSIGTKPAPTHSRQVIETKGDSDICGTRRILYLMYARPWFTDHVNFDYTKSATSLWGDDKKVDDSL